MKGPQNISTTELIAFSAPSLAVVFIMAPLGGILPGIYAKYFGLELAAIASVLLISRLFDGLSDPLVGYFCDRHRSVGGPRKYWVVAGGLLLLVAAYYLFLPPPDVSVTYYLIWSVAIYLGWTMASIPHNAWGFELTGDYNQRVKVSSYLMGAAFLGTCCFYILPFLPISSFSMSEYTPATLQTALIIGTVLMVVTLTFTYFKAPSGHFEKSSQQDSVRSLLHSIIHNKPLLIFLATYSSFAFSFGMWGVISFMYFDGFLNLGDKIAFIFLAGSVCATCVIPLATRLVELTSKQTSWTICMAIYSVMVGGFWFLQPNSHWILPLLLSCGAYVGIALHSVVSMSMLGDIVDYGEWKFHRNRGAMLSALLVFFFKVSAGIAAATGVAVVGYFGFVAATHLQTESAIFGLKLGMIILPLTFALLAIVLTLFNPISDHRHQIIRKKIQRRRS